MACFSRLTNIKWSQILYFIASYPFINIIDLVRAALFFFYFKRGRILQSLFFRKQHPSFYFWWHYKWQYIFSTYNVCTESTQPLWISHKPVAQFWCNIMHNQSKRALLCICKRTLFQGVTQLAVRHHWVSLYTLLHSSSDILTNEHITLPYQPLQFLTFPQS